MFRKLLERLPRWCELVVIAVFVFCVCFLRPSRLAWSPLPRKLGSVHNNCVTRVRADRAKRLAVQPRFLPTGSRAFRAQLFSLPLVRLLARIAPRVRPTFDVLRTPFDLLRARDMRRSFC